MLKPLPTSQMYSDASAAITALADRLRASGGAFFFGSRPSSLDALLVGHLIYFRLCPAAPPVLQQKVWGDDLNQQGIPHWLMGFNCCRDL